MFSRFLFSALMCLSLGSLTFAQSDGCKSVEVPVGVVNANGESFRGLSPSDFSGRAGRAVLPLKSMTYDDGPRRVVLVVDVAKKVSGETRKAERALIETILAAARPQDSLALVTARGPEKVVKFGEDRSQFLQALPDEGDARHGKEAGVLDAVMQAIELFGDAKPGDSIIVIAADLEGNHNANAKRVAKALQEHRIRMFGLALGPVSARNIAVSGQGTTAWGLATATPATGTMIYDTGDQDFYPLTKDSGGIVIGVMNGDYRHSYTMKDPKFEARVKQEARTVYNMVAGYYRVELEPHRGDWNLEASDNLRKAVPVMFLLYPHELSACSADSHIAKN
jgi:hypothetical protein